MRPHVHAGVMTAMVVISVMILWRGAVSVIYAHNRNKPWAVALDAVS